MPQVSPIIAWIVLFATMGSAVTLAQAPQRNPPGPGIVRLAERGDARAQTRLGFMLATGRGAPQNLVEAAYWYQRSAEQGDPDAQYLLGVCYDLGNGVPRDWVLAHKWLNLSAAGTRAGDEREHRIRMRDAIASKLSRSQIALAQDLAIAWRPKRER